MVKFRYGKKDYYGGITYIESKYEYTDGLYYSIYFDDLMDGDYIIEAVIYDNNGILGTTSQEFKYKKKEMNQDSNIVLSNDDLYLIGYANNSVVTTATLEEVDPNHTVNWTLGGGQQVDFVVDDTTPGEYKITFKTKNLKLEELDSDLLNNRFKLTAYEYDGDNLVATYSKIINVKFYPVVTLMNLYVDSAAEVYTTKVMMKNSYLEYTSVTDNGDNTKYEFDSDADSVTAKAKGTGSLTVEGSFNEETFTYDVNINVLNVFEVPTDEEIIDNLKVYESKEVMFGSHKNCQYRIYEYESKLIGNINLYLFRNNPVTEIVWNYDICAVTPLTLKTALNYE